MKLRSNLLFFVITVMLISCDAAQEAHGIIMDKATKTPIDSVAIGKGEKVDYDEPWTRRRYSKKDGSFQYNAISGSSDFELYFSKDGYATVKREYTSKNRPDTVYLVKAK